MKRNKEELFDKLMKQDEVESNEAGFLLLAILILICFLAYFFKKMKLVSGLVML